MFSCVLFHVAITFLHFLHSIQANPSPQACVKRGLEISCPTDTRIAIIDPKLSPCDFTSRGSLGENAMWSQCNLRQGCGFEGLFKNELDVAYKCVPYIPGYVHDMCTAHIEDSPFLYLSSPHYTSPGKRAPCICGAFMTRPTTITIYISNDLMEDQELSVEIDGRTPIHVTSKTPGTEYGKITRTVQTFIRIGFINGNPRVGGGFLLLYEVEGDRTIQFICEKVPILPVIPRQRPLPTSPDDRPLPSVYVTTGMPSMETLPSVGEGSLNEDKLSDILVAVLPVVLLVVMAGLVVIFVCRRRNRDHPKKKITGNVPLNSAMMNNLENFRPAGEATGCDVRLNRTYGLVETDNLFASSRHDDIQPKEYHYACFNLEEAKYANDLGDRKYANVSAEAGFAGGAGHNDGSPSCASGSSRRAGPVAAPRTLKSTAERPHHFYSNLEKADYLKCTNLEREELMKENGLFQEISQTLKARATASAPVPTPKGSTRRPSQSYYANLPDSSVGKDVRRCESSDREQLQSGSSLSGLNDTYYTDEMDQSECSDMLYPVEIDQSACSDTFYPVEKDQSPRRSSFLDRDSESDGCQIVSDDLADYQPVDFGPNTDQWRDNSVDSKIENDTQQTDYYMKENDLYESAECNREETDDVDDVAGGLSHSIQDGEFYQPVDINTGKEEAIMKDNDLYQPLNIGRENYVQDNDIYQDV